MAGLLLALGVLLSLSGCATTPPAASPTSSKTAEAASVFEPSVSPPASSEEALPAISLKASNFGGEIALEAAKATAVGDGFQLPVYLRNVTAVDAVDTVTLKAFLPEGMRLKQVLTPSGFTAQLDGAETPAPVVYFHSLSLSQDSYSPVIGGDEPIFTLVFSGQPKGKLAAEGSFFRADAVLMRTNRAVLQL